MIPTPWTLYVKRYNGTTSDTHGNTVDSFADPMPWHVHAIAPGAMTEPGEPGREASQIAFTILAPATSQVPGERDLVVVDGDDYPVNGRPADWTRGPWQHPDAGVTVELRRVEG